MLHVELNAPFPEFRSNDICQEILIVNTHLLFPHDSSLCIVRFQQVTISLFTGPRQCLLLVKHSVMILFSLLCNRSTKFCNMWNPTKRRISLILCPLYYAGNFISSHWILIAQTLTSSLVFLYLLLCFSSDWNGSKRGHIYKFLRSLGFVSSYDTAHQYTDADAQKVSSILFSLCGTSFRFF